MSEKNKYKLETWKIKKWRNTEREIIKEEKRLVMRDAITKRFSKNKPVITDIREKVYGSGVYYVGYVNGKAVVRQLKVKRNLLWYETKKEEMKKEKKVYRTSYVLNNIPISKKGYFGFRIVVFGTNEQALRNLREKMKRRLIKWIEECIRYKEQEFWFDMYFGYESPHLSNALRNENGKYYLTEEDKHGLILKEKYGSVGEL